jgi:cellulose biosynthesis protein BcsQ
MLFCLRRGYLLEIAEVARVRFLLLIRMLLMGVVCFASLKGGVGKTSISINVAHALANRGCETLLIDLDPAGHSSRFFCSSEEESSKLKSPLERLFIRSDRLSLERDMDSLLEDVLKSDINLIKPVRSSLAVLSSGVNLKNFIYGNSGRNFKQLFGQLVQELTSYYDYIIIDTPPDYNVLTESAIIAANLVVVPVDCSAMSIVSLEEIVESADHIKNTGWCILRTMVNRQAVRVRRMAQSRLDDSLSLRTTSVEKESPETCIRSEVSETNVENPDDFISLFSRESGASQSAAASGEEDRDSQNPIYLLDSIIYRTEQQNRLSFTNKTAFDGNGTRKLAGEYSTLAKELESVLALIDNKVEEDFPVDQFLQTAMLGG